MKEVWKDIAGHDGKYQVSNKGNVRELISIAIYRKLNPYEKNGYAYVKLGKKSYRVHILVIEAFEKSRYQVNHKDGNKRNNDLENLEYITKSENALHSYRVLGKSNSKMPVMRSDGKRFESKRAAARSVDGYDSMITQVCEGKASQYKGFKFSYISERVAQ